MALGLFVICISFLKSFFKNLFNTKKFEQKTTDFFSEHLNPDWNSKVGRKREREGGSERSSLSLSFSLSLFKSAAPVSAFERGKGMV